MEDVSLFILSLSDGIHAFFNVLFEKAKWRTEDTRVYGAHWHRVFFRGIYASPENKQSEREARRSKYLYFIMFQTGMTLILFVCFQLLMNRSI